MINLTSPREVLAGTCRGEARGDGEAGMQAVANVVVNRVAAGRWGADVIAVCLAREQFDCWDENDPNRAYIMAAEPGDPSVILSLDIARRALAGELPDITHGADSYYGDYIAAPAWTVGLTPTARIGRQIFYNVRDAAPASALDEADALNQAELDQLKGDSSD